MAKRLITVNDILAGHVSLDVACLDRIYLNGYLPTVQVPGQVVQFLQHRGFPIPSPAVVEKMPMCTRQGSCVGRPSTTVTSCSSHASAAGLHQLGDLLDDQHEFTFAQRKQTARGGIRIHRGDLLEQDVTVVEGLPVTTVERTIADLLRAGHDPEHVAQIIGQGIRRGVVDLTDLAAHLDPLARRHNQPDGSGLVEYLLDIVGLSQAALARELAQSPAGQGLLAAGRLSAIAEMVASISPQINVSQLFGPDKLDFGKNAGLSETFALQRSMAAVQPAPHSRTDR